MTRYSNTTPRDLAKTPPPMMTDQELLQVILGTKPEARTSKRITAALELAEGREATQRLSQAGKLLGIEVLDHLILGRSDFYSFRDNGEVFL